MEYGVLIIPIPVHYSEFWLMRKDSWSNKWVNIQWRVRRKLCEWSIKYIGTVEECCPCLPAASILIPTSTHYFTIKAQAKHTRELIQLSALFFLCIFLAIRYYRTDICQFFFCFKVLSKQDLRKLLSWVSLFFPDLFRVWIIVYRAKFVVSYRISYPIYFF